MAFKDFEKEISNDDGNSINVSIEQGGSVAAVVGDALKVTGGGGGFEVLDNQLANLISDLGSILAGFDGTNYQFVATDSNGHLQVDVLSGAGGGTQIIDGQVANGADTGVLIGGTDGSNYQFLSVDSDGQLQIDVLSSVLPTGAATASNQLPDGHNVTVDNILSDPIPSQITDGIDVVSILDDAGIGRLQVEAKIAAGGASQDVHIVDADGDDMDLVPDVAIPAGTRALLIAGYDEADIARVPFVVEDPTDGIHRMAIQGKISVSAPTPPAAATSVTVAADTPLNVSGTETTDYEIATGETFTIQQITAGAEGDPTEKGAVIRVSYLDGAGTSHIIEQIYLTGQTVQIFPDTSTARDGTALVGVAGAGLGTIRIEREQFGGGTRELDVVLRGFEQ